MKFTARNAKMTIGGHEAVFFVGEKTTRSASVVMKDLGVSAKRAALASKRLRKAWDDAQSDGRVTRKAICDAIKAQTGYDVKIQKENGYFYFYSDDDKTDLFLHTLPSTSVNSNRLGCQNIEAWVGDFKRIIGARG